MGVHVDEAGGDEPAVGVDDPTGGRVDPLGDVDDASRPDTHVGWAGGRAGAVDHAAGADQEVEVAPRGRFDPVQVERVAPEQPGSGHGVEVAVALAQLVHDARVLRVAVGEVRRPDEPVGARERAQHPHGPFAGVEADPALPPEVLLGGQRQVGCRPPVALLELAEPVHPVRDPPAPALQDDHLQVRVPFEHTAIGEVRKGHLLVEQQDQRVVGARGHPLQEPPCRARHVGQARRVQGEGQPGLLERLPHRRIGAVMERTPLVGVRTGEAADEPQVADPSGLGGRRARVLEGQRTDPAQPVRRRGRPFGEPVVVDLAARDGELRVLDPTELESEPRVDDGEVDPLRVEDLHAARGVEAGRVQVLVVATLPEVLERLAGVAEPDEAPVGRDLVVDEALVVAGRLVPAQPDAPVAQVRREVAGPQVGGLADVTVRVDDDFVRFAHPSRIPGPGVAVNAVPIIGPQQ